VEGEEAQATVYLHLLDLDVAIMPPPPSPTPTGDVQGAWGGAGYRHAQALNLAHGGLWGLVLDGSSAGGDLGRRAMEGEGSRGRDECPHQLRTIQ